MITPDANIVIYAYNEDSPFHEQARGWLEEQINSQWLFGMTWQTATAFLRITTNPKAFPVPLALQEATDIVQVWASHPKIKFLTPTENHWSIFRGLVLEGQTTSALMMDAHLAALAIEHGATLATSDRDFTRFAELKTMNPLK